MCKANLFLQPDYLSIEELGILDAATTTTLQKGGKKETSTSVLATHNAYIEALFSSQEFLQTHLAPEYHLSKSVPTVLQSFFLPFSTLTSMPPEPPSHDFEPPDSKLSLLPSLSTLALALLIATARLDILHDTDTANFNMVYDEYVSLASKARIQSAAGGISSASGVSKVWGKAVAKREWEELLKLGLVMPVLLSGQGQAGDMFSMVRCDVSLEEIGAVIAGEPSVEKGLERWCKQL